VAIPQAALAIDRASAPRAPVAAGALVGLGGGLFAGATGPFVSTFVPPLVQSVRGGHRTAIGFVMAIDNLLLLLLVPLAGAASERSFFNSSGRAR
jgi:hypothetical protein